MRGVVIKMYGDKDITTAIADGMVLPAAEPLDRDKRETVEAEIDRQRIVQSLVRVAVGNQTTPDEYRAMMVRERYRRQRYERPAGIARRVADGLLVAWAMVWMAIYGAAEYLSSYREG